MNARFCRACAVVAFALCSTVAARAGEIPIDISGLVNEPWTVTGPNGISNGSTFPTGSQNFGGVPFLIPSGPNNFWSGASAAHSGGGIVGLTIPVGVAGVTSVYTLLNTMWGQPGPQTYLSITFTGTGGATSTQALAGGVNVRDYNQDGYQNAVNNTTSVQVWSNGQGQRLDRQEFILPASFASQVLTSVTITDSGNETFSRAVFAGLTVSTCQSYVPARVHIAGGAVIYHPSTGYFTQNVYVSNVDVKMAVNGPLFLILEDLPTRVYVGKQAGLTACYAPLGSPYVIAIPKGGSLAPQTTTVLQLSFADPTGTPITYTPLAVASHASPP
jgi:hypothetical protein